jgi:hypothetical protein
VNIKRRSTSWHAEHMKVWRSKPRTDVVSSWTTFIKIISASQAIQRIARTPKPQAPAQSGSSRVLTACLEIPSFIPLPEEKSQSP